MAASQNKFSITSTLVFLMIFGYLLISCTFNPQPTSNPASLPSPETIPSPENSKLLDVSFEGIRFSYDRSLASTIEPKIVSTRFGSDYAPWEQTPTHLAFHFINPYTTGRDLYWQGFTPNPAPVIFIYQTSDFPEPVLGWDGLAQVQSLQTFLKERPNTTEEKIPLLPLTNAGQSFHAKLKYLEFNGGSGVRFITQYTQEPRMINNQELIYTFQGMTSDGAFSISALLPVSAQSLPAKHEIEEEKIPGFWAGFEKYIREAAQKVNTIPDESFDPQLSILDSVFESLSFP